MSSTDDTETPLSPEEQEARDYEELMAPKLQLPAWLEPIARLISLFS